MPHRHGGGDDKPKPLCDKDDKADAAAAYDPVNALAEVDVLWSYYGYGIYIDYPCVKNFNLV